jgi:trans-aconitate methyltransferase
MALNDKSYWNDRVSKFGHTGWSDFATYYYDQNLRLNAIKQIIADSELKIKTALDYGCGTGDFSKLLTKYCDKVIATDISDKVIEKANSDNKNDNIEYHELSDNIFSYKYELILSVTVLQHILDDEKLSELIGKFESSLRDHGKIIVFESFAKNGVSSNYQKLREVDDFVKAFREYGLTRESVLDFYHPSNMPTKLFEKYRSKLIVRILNRLCLLRVPGARLLLRQLAYYFSSKDNGIIENESITKILVFGK